MTNAQILSRVKAWRHNGYVHDEWRVKDDDALAAIEKMLADYEAIQKRFDEFAKGVQQLIFDLNDKPRGTGG